MLHYRRVLSFFASSLLILSCGSLYAETSAPQYHANALLHLSPSSYKWSATPQVLPNQVVIAKVYDGPNNTSWAVGSTRSTFTPEQITKQSTHNAELGVKLDFYNGASWATVPVNLPTPGGNDWIVSVYPFLYHSENAAVITILNVADYTLTYELLYNKADKWQHQMLLQNQPQLTTIYSQPGTGNGAHVVALDNNLYIAGLVGKNSQGGIALYSAVAGLSASTLSFKLYPMAVPAGATTATTHIAVTSADSVYDVGGFTNANGPVPALVVSNVYKLSASGDSRVAKGLYSKFPLVNLSGNTVVINAITKMLYSTDGGVNWQVAPLQFNNTSDVNMDTQLFGYFTNGRYCNYGVDGNKVNCFDFKTKAWQHNLYAMPYSNIHSNGYAVLSFQNPAAWFIQDAPRANAVGFHIGVVRFDLRSNSYSPVMSCSAIPFALDGSYNYVSALPASTASSIQGVSLAVIHGAQSGMSDWLGTKVNSNWHATTLPADISIRFSSDHIPFSSDGRWVYVADSAQSQK